MYLLGKRFLLHYTSGADLSAPGNDAAHRWEDEWRRLKTLTSHRSVRLWPQLEAILRLYFAERERGGGLGRLLLPSPTSRVLRVDAEPSLEVGSERLLGRSLLQLAVVLERFGAPGPLLSPLNQRRSSPHPHRQQALKRMAEAPLTSQSRQGVGWGSKLICAISNGTSESGVVPAG